MTQVAATGSPAYTETLPHLPEAATAARLLVTLALAVWNLDALTDDAKLIVTELVANAADHARGDSIRVTVTRLDEYCVHIAVVDKSRAQPRLREAGPDEVAGRGLAMVEALSSKWGADPLPWGKRVWAELEAAS